MSTPVITQEQMNELMKYCGFEPDTDKEPTGFFCKDQNNKKVLRTTREKEGNLVRITEYNYAHRAIHIMEYLEDDEGNRLKPFEKWYEYDSETGRCISARNSTGYEEKYTYDTKSGRLIEMTTSEGVTTAYPIIDGVVRECKKVGGIIIYNRSLNSKR